MTNKKYYWFAMTLEQLLFGFRVSFECKNKQQNSYFEIVTVIPAVIVLWAIPSDSLLKLAFSYDTALWKTCNSVFLNHSLFYMHLIYGRCNYKQSSLQEDKYPQFRSNHSK